MFPPQGSWLRAVSTATVQHPGLKEGPIQPYALTYPTTHPPPCIDEDRRRDGTRWLPQRSPAGQAGV
jgi:hypothetical protein